MDVAQEWERQLARLVERRVAERRVRADAEDARVALRELRGDLIQAAQLRRSDAAPVVTVEDQDDVAAAQIGEVHLRAAGRRQREVGRWLTKAESVHGRHPIT